MCPQNPNLHRSTGGAPMAKRRRPPPPPLHASAKGYFWLGMTYLAATSVLVCLLAFLRISTSLMIDSSFPPSGSHLAVSYTTLTSHGVPKVAFLFLAQADLPLDFLWHVFFLNADQQKFSIYVHSSPGFVFDKRTTRSHYFYGRQLKHSVKVSWGEVSMIQAEKLLLKAALEDPDNQRFILLSDRCIPLYNFSYTYNYVISSSKSFVDSFLDLKDQRYDPNMFPTITKDKWRKGSQWITLTRQHAMVVVSDATIFSIFKNHCKKDPTREWHACIPDEHYVQTLFSMLVLGSELERRTLTYSAWRQGWHPLTFEFADASPRRIKEIKDINSVHHETEFRSESCRNNGSLTPCFLFARKFSNGAAMRLLHDWIFDATKPPYGQLNLDV